MSQQQYVTPGRLKLNNVETSAIRDRIMKEMLALEEERVARMQEGDSVMVSQMGEMSGSSKTMEDESIIRRELNKVDPSAVVFSESWAAKKVLLPAFKYTVLCADNVQSRIRQSSPYGHLARWDCMSVIVKTGGDLRQEQLAVQLIREFQAIWTEEKSGCWVKQYVMHLSESSLLPSSHRSPQLPDNDHRQHVWSHRDDQGCCLDSFYQEGGIRQAPGRGSSGACYFAGPLQIREHYSFLGNFLVLIASNRPMAIPHQPSSPGHNGISPSLLRGTRSSLTFSK
jgi:hypothetical protein